MNKITITIETTNAVFEDNFDGEVARLLKGLSEQFAQGNQPTRGNDLNGNKVLTIKYE